MKKLFLLVTLAVAAVAFTGCVHASKKSGVVHTIRDFTVVAPTNGSPVSLLAREEIWTDDYRDGGSAFFADPKASELNTQHANQVALGGNSTLSVGEVSSTVSSNTAPIINATGSALGAVIGEAVKAATGNPVPAAK